MQRMHPFHDPVTLPLGNRTNFINRIARWVGPGVGVDVVANKALRAQREETDTVRSTPSQSS
jgi:hypothetical protein